MTCSGIGIIGNLFVSPTMIEKRQPKMEHLRAGMVNKIDIKGRGYQISTALASVNRVGSQTHDFAFETIGVKDKNE